jgi:hypothetical protein
MHCTVRSQCVLFSTFSILSTNFKYRTFVLGTPRQLPVAERLFLRARLDDTNDTLTGFVALWAEPEEYIRYHHRNSPSWKRYVLPVIFTFLLLSSLIIFFYLWRCFCRPRQDTSSPLLLSSPLLSFSPLLPSSPSLLSFPPLLLSSPSLLAFFSDLFAQ